MEMESSRRPPYDRSREPGLKKPRLAEQSAVVVDRNPNGRTVAQRPANSGGSVPGSGLVKYRANNIDRDRDFESSDSARGPNQQQQHQELVSQYRTALAELTFNSKPIITNLTIIAGENLHAAKAIAATVCANIIEVPSDQKLPSLYLLDSIVKNIGRDYIKYFAAKLPEVFCKAYRQVESAVHTAMRHLFGTWKGVFPPQPLQMIEKELDFSPAANGSSTGSAGARVDPESQRPGRIHINPKYLEARQRLEQSSRVKGESNDNTGVLGKSPDDAVSLDRAVGSTSGKSLADPRLKMQNIQRSLKDLSKESVGEKNNAAAYGGYEFSTDISGHPGVEPGRASERAGERKFDKSWYASAGNVTEAMSSKRNTIDTKPGFASYLAPTTTGTNAHLLPAQSTAGRSISGTNRSWKNSEEEEYMWNDMNSKSSDYDKINSSRKDVSMPDSSDRLGFVSHLQKPHNPDSFNSRIDREPLIDSLPIEQKDHLGNLISSSWTKEPYSTDGIIHLGGSRITPGHSDAFPTASSLTRMSVRPQVGPSQIGPSGFGFVSKPVSSSSGLLGQRHYMGAASTLDQPLSHHGHQLLHNLRDQDHLQNQPFGRQELRTSQFSGPINVKPSNQSSQASMPPNAYPGNLHILQSHDLQTPLMPSGRRAPFPERLSPDPLQSEQSNKSYIPHNAISRNPPTTLGLPSGHANPLAAESSGQPNPSSLLATIMKSGILNKSVTSSVPTSSFPVLGVKGSQPTSSGPRVGVESPPGLNTNDKVLAAAVPTQRKVDHPTVPPGRLPPSVVENESSQVSQSANPALVSNLLSSLFSKGLITSSKSEPKPSVPQQVHAQIQNQKSNIVSSGSVPISSVSVTATISAPSDIKLSKPEAEGSSGLLHSPNIKPLLGCEFKQDVIRQANPAVVRELIDDLPHQCNICGVRLKLQQRLERHLEWHKSVEANSLNKASRRWYVNSADWIAGKARTDCGNESICVLEAMEIEMESSEDMVLADESQCVCVLCGELFEDFYSLEKNDWMFKGAVYMPTSLGNGKMGETSSGGIFKGPIVHANCMSNISALDMELAGSMKLEKDG